MNDPVSISTDNKATVVRIGAVSILFSYTSCVAFRAGEVALVDPTYRGMSSTTSKHINGAGFRSAPDAASSDAFTKALGKALKEAL